MAMARQMEYDVWCPGQQTCDGQMMVCRTTEGVLQETPKAGWYCFFSVAKLLVCGPV